MSFKESGFGGGGSSGGGFVSNVRLGPEQGPIDVGLNERDLLLGGTQMVFPHANMQCDVLNPLHQFKISAVEVIIADNNPVATLMEVGVCGLVVDGSDIPTVDLQMFYGRSIPVEPLQDTVMKIAISDGKIIAGDTVVTPWWIGNGNIMTRQQNATGGANARLTSVVNGPWEAVDDKPWVSSSYAGFFRVYFRRLIDAP